MLVQTAQIEGTTRSQYDGLLASGWFRGTGVLYRSELVCIDEQVFAVQHIRLPLHGFSPNKKQRKILRTNDGMFRCTIGTPSCDDRKEELYQGHIKKFKAFVHHTLNDMINGPRYDAEIETRELCVYHGDELVAVSYFDIGENSMASILCLYDRSYSKFSLGHYTMLKEMEFAMSESLEYYYPGYVLDMPSSFDYKLTIGKCEWLSNDRNWYPQDSFIRPISQGDIIRGKMAELRVRLTILGYDIQYHIYPYFTIGQVMVDRGDLVSLPCFFSFYAHNMLVAASYDPVLSMFVVFDIQEADDLEFTQHLELSDDYRENAIYELRVLKTNFYTSLYKFQAGTASIFQQKEDEQYA